MTSVNWRHQEFRTWVSLNWVIFREQHSNSKNFRLFTKKIPAHFFRILEIYSFWWRRLPKKPNPTRPHYQLITSKLLFPFLSLLFYFRPEVGFFFVSNSNYSFIWNRLRGVKNKWIPRFGRRFASFFFVFAMLWDRLFSQFLFFFSRTFLSQFFCLYLTGFSQLFIAIFTLWNFWLFIP